MKLDITIILLVLWSYHFRHAICQNGEILSQLCGADGNVRLLGGVTNMEGSLQVCRDGMWGGVRYCGQSNVDANVICNQLGYSRTGNGKC